MRAHSMSERPPVTAGITTASAIERDAAIHRCAILHSGGAHLSDGLAILIDRDSGTEARVTELAAPGAVLAAYVSRGVRRFLLSLDDTAPVPADLIDTTWQPNGRRLCRFLIGRD